MTDSAERTSKFSLGSRRRLHYIGPDYLVMEYIEGAPLKEPLPVDEAVRLAVQIASALEAATQPITKA